MKNTNFSFFKTKKIGCIIACLSLLFTTSCTALGLPEKDPAGKLRAYYQEGKDGKANDILIKHKLVAETSNISYPGVEIRTLPSQLEKGAFDDAKHTLYHVALFGQSSSYDYFPLLTLDLLSEKDWHFDTEDNIIAKHRDKVLFQLCYGSGKFATLIYSIKDDTLVAVMDLIEHYPQLGTALLGFFAMNSNLQGQGIGTEIISGSVAYLAQVGFPKVRLGIDKGNPQSKAFWLKNGFAFTGKEYESDGSTIFVMERTL